MRHRRRGKYAGTNEAPAVSRDKPRVVFVNFACTGQILSRNSLRHCFCQPPLGCTGAAIFGVYFFIVLVSLFVFSRVGAVLCLELRASVGVRVCARLVVMRTVLLMLLTMLVMMLLIIKLLVLMTLWMMLLMMIRG